MAIIFEDNFTNGIKSEWNSIVGDWQHNSELDAYQIIGIAKNKTKVDIATPDDVLVECKIIGLNTLQNTYFDLLNRYSFDSNSGYSIAYVEVYSRFYDLALILFPWNNNSRGEGLDYITWAELGLSGILDLEGKTIGIKCEGNVIKGYLDGVEILSVVDDSYSSGQTGLIVNPRIESLIFDDFKIIGDTPPPLRENNMSLFKKKINPFTGKFDYVFKGNLVHFQEGVATASALPSSGNVEGDAIIANDNHHLYIWDGSAWQDQGDIIDIKWATLEDKPTSSVENIDDAVSKKHVRQHSIVDSSDHSDKNDYIDVPLSPMILTGGFISDGTNAGTVKVSALTTLLRTTDSVVGELVKITLVEQDNQILPLADTIYKVILDYNNNSPLIKIQTDNANGTTQIGIGICIKDSSDNIHFCNCGFHFSNGVFKLHRRAYVLREIELASGCVIGEVGTRNITVTSGIVYHGINGLTPFSEGTFDTSVTAPDTFTYFYRDGDTGWTRVIDQTQIDNANYDDDSGTLHALIAQQYGIHWVYLHPDDEHIYIVYGQDSYLLSQAAVATPPATLPIEVSDFSVLIGRILIKKNSATFESIQSAVATLFNPTGVEDHNESANLQGGTVSEYYHLTSAEHTNKYIQGNEIKIKVYNQDTEPTLSENQKMAIWENTSVSGSPTIFLIYRRGTGDQIKVELT